MSGVVKHALCYGQIRDRECVRCHQTFGNDIEGSSHIQRRDFDEKLAGRCRHCGDKRAYTNIRDAENHKLELAPKDDNPTLSVYCCDFCGKWHVGHRRSLRATSKSEQAATAVTKPNSEELK